MRRWKKCPARRKNSAFPSPSPTKFAWNRQGYLFTKHIHGLDLYLIDRMIISGYRVPSVERKLHIPSCSKRDWTSDIDRLVAGEDYASRPVIAGTLDVIMSGERVRAVPSSCIPDEQQLKIAVGCPTPCCAGVTPMAHRMQSRQPRRSSAQLFSECLGKARRSGANSS